MSEKKDLSRQVAVIARVMEETGLSREALADFVLVKPETLRKAAQGHQPLSDRVLGDIKRVPAMISAQIGGKMPAAPGGTTALSPKLPTISATCQRLSFVLGHTTSTEAAMLTSLVDTAFRQVSDRLLNAIQPSDNATESDGHGIIHIPVGHKLRAVLGDIAAGLPQEAIAQADQWVPVPPKYAKDTTFVLRVRGDSMVDKGVEDGDLVYINANREPRNGDIVAALCDHETTLKTFVLKAREKPFLRSENKAFPPKIVPAEELTIQGVMIAKHKKP